MKAGAEHVYPKLILHWMGIEQLSGPELERLRHKLDENLGADLSFNSLGPGKSWNIPQMRMAARVLAPGGGKHFDWWKQYFDFQLGLVPSISTYPLLGFFDGNEPFSPTYTPWRWGAVAAVRFAAEHATQGDIVDLCDRWFAAAAWMADRMSSGQPDIERQKNRKGQLFDNAWHVSPVGERGASGHEITDTRLLMAPWHGPQDFFTKRADWPLKAMRACGAYGRPMHACDDRDSLRWHSEQNVLTYPSGRLVYKPERKNWNTPCYMFDWFDYEKKTAVLGFPWNEGRQSGAKGGGWCGIEPDGGGMAVVARTDYGQARCAIPHPLNEPILSHIVFGPEGFKKLF